VGTAAEACSFMRLLVAIPKCLKPNSFAIALFCYFLPNYIFAIYISLGTLQSSWVEGPNRQFMSPDFEETWILEDFCVDTVRSSLKPLCSPPTHTPSCLNLRTKRPHDTDLLPQLSPHFLAGIHLACPSGMGSLYVHWSTSILVNLNATSASCLVIPCQSMLHLWLSWLA
jgi:hypothetical protein